MHPQNAVAQFDFGRSCQRGTDRELPGKRGSLGRRWLTPNQFRNDAMGEALDGDHLPDTIRSMRLILASASPRRAELLTSAGIDFDVSPASIDETPNADEPPREYVLRLARAKAIAARRARNDHAPVLGADTTVVAAGRMLGKPNNDAEAATMLRLLSGAVHEVHTGVVLLMSGRDIAEVVTTRVRFLPLSQSEIDWYISTGEPGGKAGAYAIQGAGSRFIDWIDGSWSNVVGLPVATVYRMLRDAGVVS
jgi:nucleoside triphosphate pyrophosphatase